MSAATHPALEVAGLTVALTSGAPVVEDLSATLAPGEVLGLVGESGSGKTTAALALLGFARPGARIVAGSVRVGGEQIIGRAGSDLRGVRGRLVSYVPQDPATALNPAIRVGALVREIAEAHRPDLDAGAAVRGVLERVELPFDRAFQRRYPHQLSGGQQQRLAIAMALVCQPPLVVFDEPTTGLDVVTQARILAEIARLRAELGVAMVYVSHDLAVVSSVADRIAVMYAGRIVEEGPAHVLVGSPRHPYAHGLVASVPDHANPRRLQGIRGVAVGVGGRATGCAFAPRCDIATDVCLVELPRLEPIAPGHLVRCFEWPRASSSLPGARDASREPGSVALLTVAGLRAEHRARDGIVIAADDVSFGVAPGECVALVGESGSGKTTVARCVAGLHLPAAGTLMLDSRPLAGRARDRPREQRRRLQIVFQNPYDSLNPRRSVEDALLAALARLRGIGGADARSEAAGVLERVRLPVSLARRFPAELSGGERQRVAIARALVARPDMLVCDEVTSALDVSVQAAVLDLLGELRRESGLALLFITHDLGVVASIADRVLVLEHGVVREQGRVETILRSPEDAYTQRLVAAAPSLRTQAAGS